MRWLIAIALLFALSGAAQAADEAKTFEILAYIVQCESGGKHDNIWGKHGEYGWFQFKEKSFYFLANKMKLKGMQWKNKHHQYIIAKWGIENGYSNWWTCAKNL